MNLSGSPGMPPTIMLFVRLQGDEPIKIGLVHAVPPLGAEVTFRDLPYSLVRVVWEISEAGRSPRLHAVLWLEPAVLSAG